MAGEGIELEIYKFATPTVKAATLTGRKEPQVLSEIKAVGGGSFKISRSDPKYLQDPHLIDSRNICKYRVDGSIVGAIVLGQAESILIGTGEKASQGYNVAGEGLKIWFDDAELRPYGGLQREDGSNRYFNFATERGSWYVSGDWTDPHIMAQVDAYSAWTNDGTGQYTPRPAEWPSGAPTSDWVWASAYADPQNDAWCYFRWEVNIATAGTHAIYFAVDNYFTMYIDGEQVAQNLDKHQGWTETTRISYEFSTGDHVIAFQARNASSNEYQGPAALLAALFRLGTNNTEILISESGDANWKARAYPSSIPSWTIGEIMLKLLTEASARGVLFPTYCTPTFTASVDSAGVNWVDKLEWAFAVGESYASIFSKFEELVDIWIDPANYNINVHQTRGVDRTVYVGAESARTSVPIELRIGEHLTEASTTTRGKMKNAMSLKTTDGWFQSSDSTSVSKYGRLEGSLDTGVNPELAIMLAGLVFDQRADEEEGASYNFVTTTYKPHIHFDIGDWLLAPDKLGLAVPRRVMSITTTENTAGKPIYNVEFDTIFRSNEERTNKILEKLGGGGVGGSMSNVGGSTPGVGVPVILPPTSTTTQKTPKAPTNVIATSQGKWTADGVTAYTELTLTWDPVTQYTDNSAMVPDHYNIRGVKSGDPNYVDWGYVTGTTAKLQPFNPTEEWTFSVQAVSTMGVEGAFGASSSHTMAGPAGSLLAPDMPVMSSSRGTLTMNWSGLLNSQTPPPEFRYVFAEIGLTDTGPWNRVGPSLDRTQRNVGLPNVTVGGVYYSRFIAVDGAGYLSSASPVAGPHTILGIVGPDILANSVDANVITAGTIQTSHLSPQVGDQLNISANSSILLVAGQVSTVEDELDGTQSNLETMQTYYAFGATGAIISKPGSVFSTAIRSDRIEMLENGNVISFWSSGIFNVNQMVVDKITLGNHQIEKYGADDTVMRAL